MTTREELNASFEQLGVTVLRCKAERDEFLRLCKAAYSAEFGSLDVPAPQGTYWATMQDAIARAEAQ